MKTPEYYLNDVTRSSTPLNDILTPEGSRQVRAFHRGIPGYEPTPLHRLSSLAKKLGVKGFYVKDESPRFGLNAFKSLGGSYAMGRVLCQELGIPMDEGAFSRLISHEIRQELGGRTFITATDGNHGRGVAWMANKLRQRAVVYMPQGTVPERLQNIRALGAEAEILPMNYDDCVRRAAVMASAHGWALVQDTAWEGYEEIPLWIMAGYTTMAGEIAEQLPPDVIPTHLFLQAGVGSMAAAVAAYAWALWGDSCPKIIVVEPDRADCFYRTAKANDGLIHPVTGNMDSIMAGLCCGEPCPPAWEILKALAWAFISCDDDYTKSGMRRLYHPIGDDPVVISGESGAVTTGIAAAILEEETLEGLRNALGMDENSVILCISTEGDTDRENFRRIVEGTP